MCKGDGISGNIHCMWTYNSMECFFPSFCLSSSSSSLICSLYFAYRFWFFLYPFSSFFSYFLLLSILSFRFFSLVQNRFLIHLARYNQNDGMQNIIKQKKWKRQEYSNSKKKSANTYKYHMQRRAREAQFFFHFRLCRYYKYA